MNLFARLEEHASTQPNKVAVTQLNGDLTYSQLLAKVEQLRETLEGEQVKPESVVGVSYNEDIQHLIDCLALDAIGATMFALGAHDSEAQQHALAERCGATHFLQDGKVIPALVAESVLNPADEARHLFTTSGTTGQPKLVIQPSSSLVAQAPRHVESDNRFLCLASMEHNFARRHRLYCVAMGATNVFLENADELVSNCQQLGVNVLHVSAFQAQELLGVENCAALSGIKLKLGGSHVSASLREQLKSRITPNLYAGYGTTETGAIAFTDPADSGSGETVGRALAGLKIRIISDDGSIAAPNVEGEITIASDGLFTGYLGQPQLTDERLQQGWFHTGDIGVLDDDGRLTVCGRADDMFVFNSMNIFPQDLEACLCLHPDVVDAAVMPKRSEVHGDIPVALVRTTADANLRELKRYMREKAGARCPRQFVQVATIPRNAAGKIERTKLADLLL